MPGWLRCAQPFSKAALSHQLHLTVRGNGQALVTEQAARPAIISAESTDLGLDPSSSCVIQHHKVQTWGWGSLE